MADDEGHRARGRRTACLLMLFVINLLNYMDRLTVSGMCALLGLMLFRPNFATHGACACCLAMSALFSGV